MPIMDPPPLSGHSVPWCVLYTRHQHEKTVAHLLQSKGFEAFVPLYDSSRTWKDRKTTLSMPLFPCYVFVQNWRGRHLQMVTTPGIHMVLTSGPNVATIPDEEIQSIRKMIASPRPVEPHMFLTCGQRVRVRSGSLEGVEGLLVRKKNQCRLVLSVDLLAQSISIEVDATTVEPLEPILDSTLYGASALSLT